MKKTLLLVLALGALSFGAAAAPVIEKLEYPASVRAGEPFRLAVTASAPGEAAVSYSFNGETRTAPPGFHSFAAKDFASKYSVTAADGGVSSKSDFHALLSIPFPKDGKTYTVWVRKAGGAVCLRRPERELKWLFGKSDTYRWVSFGAFDRDKVGDALVLMAERPPYARIDRVVLTAAPETEWKPAGEFTAPNEFTWVPDRSAAGKQVFTVTVSAGGKNVERRIEVDVLPNREDKGKANKFTLKGKTRPLAIGKDAVDPADYALFDFRGKEFRKALDSKPFGLPFSADRVIALRCNAFPALPGAVVLPVGAKAAGIAFLLSEYWQGEVGQEMAHIRICYADGSELRVPLREEFELCGSLRNNRPLNALYAGTFHSAQAEFHLTVFPWANPHPEREIAELRFSNVRMEVSKEENKLIPLNVTAESSQLLLGALLLDDPADAKSLAAAADRKDAEAADRAAVTVNFGAPSGVIHPAVFSTNESGVMNSGAADFDAYLEKMKATGCRLFRFHSGWKPEKVYPDGLKNPQYESLALTVEKLKKADPNWDVMICFNEIPSYVDPKTPEGRKLFAELCADLVREFNVRRKFALRYWEIYNEVYFKKIEPDRSLWKMYNEAAAAMRKVDPSIKIGGYAPCWPSVSSIRDFYANCRDQVDFISYHKYLTGSVKTSTSYLMDQTVSFGDDARAIRAMAEEVAPGKPIELALTEYNINFNWKPHDPRQADQTGAAWFASVLNHLIRNNVEIAQTWHSRGGGTFGLFSREGDPRPAAMVFALANRYLNGDYFAAGSDSPLVEALGFRNATHAGLLLVNKSGREVTVRLNRLNSPEWKLDPMLPSVELHRVKDGKAESAQQETLPKEVRLSPYEVLLLRAAVKK